MTGRFLCLRTVLEGRLCGTHEQYNCTIYSSCTCTQMHPALSPAQRQYLLRRPTIRTLSRILFCLIHFTRRQLQVNFGRIVAGTWQHTYTTMVSTWYHVPRAPVCCTLSSCMEPNDRHGSKVNRVYLLTNRPLYQACSCRLAW